MMHTRDECDSVCKDQVADTTKDLEVNWDCQIDDTDPIKKLFQERDAYFCRTTIGSWRDTFAQMAQEN